MSQRVFPSLPGLQLDVKRTPMHRTKIVESVAGKEYRWRQMTTPRYTYRLSFEFLRDGKSGYDELKPLMGFFNLVGGSYDSWLFVDPDDFKATAEQFGVGDGVTTKFQLTRQRGGYVEPVAAVKSGTEAVFKNGVNDGLYSIDFTTGVVTFTSAPGAGVVLTWTAEFYWRCRFLQDQAEFAKFVDRLWTLKTCDFITEK